jgi:hypothetical protein
MKTLERLVLERLGFDLSVNTREISPTLTSTTPHKILTVRADDLQKLINFVNAYDRWFELWSQDVREDLEDDGSLVEAVNKLDEARKALDEI